MVQRMMQDVVEHPASVFRVGLFLSDHTDGYTAVAILRGNEDEVRAVRDTPEGALEALKKLLDALVCPSCGQRLLKPVEVFKWPPS